jgi:glutaredoxin 3
MAKRYFVEKDLPYDDVDVSADRVGLKEMVTTTGQYGVPVIVVGGRAMVGWDRGEFERLLAGDGI